MVLALIFYAMNMQILGLCGFSANFLALNKKDIFTIPSYHMILYLIAAIILIAIQEQLIYTSHYYEYY
jgi:hypothetical protein